MEEEMTQFNSLINEHVEEYLDYYCALPHTPGFAVLLKGQWGTGKTWFINQYREKLKAKKQKELYISLYGITTFSEIEDKFFQLLNPLWASKGMQVTGIILKGLLKGALKIDLNNDGKEDGSWNIQIPDIKLPKHLDNINESVLIFDDLERCNIEIGNLLGYINSFVEHQDLKVILIANEDKLLENKNYKDIKEKLIGKTFCISPDLEGALSSFINSSSNLQVKNFISKNTELISSLYNSSRYENLRNLKQIVLDFERIFESLPDKARIKLKLLQDLLRTLMIFSIEIKQGNMLPMDISKIQEDYGSRVSRKINSRQRSSDHKPNDEEKTSLIDIFDKYPSFKFKFYNLLPNSTWWEAFFDKGIINTSELKQSLLNSKYFQDENTPDWIKLLQFHDLSNDDFDKLLQKVLSEFGERKFLEIGEIKHIFGLFLIFSDAGLLHKSKEEILVDARDYIDHLRTNHRTVLISTLELGFDNSYRQFAFNGRELEEFREFDAYITKAKEVATAEEIPFAAQELILTMEKDVWKFYHMICLSEFQDREMADQYYYEVPILNYIEPSTFVRCLLEKDFENRQIVLGAITKRYEFKNVNHKLIEELDWLESVQQFLLEETSSRKGKISGYCLELLDKHYLSKAIERLREEELEI